jgi:hypothetical protein
VALILNLWQILHVLTYYRSHYPETKHLAFARQMMRRDEVLESALEDLEAHLEEILSDVAQELASAFEDLKQH